MQLVDFLGEVVGDSGLEIGANGLCGLEGEAVVGEGVGGVAGREEGVAEDGLDVGGVWGKGCCFGGFCEGVVDLAGSEELLGFVGFD